MLLLLITCIPAPPSPLRSISVTLFALYNVDQSIHSPFLAIARTGPLGKTTQPSSRRFPPRLPSPCTPMTQRSPTPTLHSSQPSPTSSDAPRSRTRHFSSPLPFERRESAVSRTRPRLQNGGDVIVRDNDVKTSWRGRPNTHLEPTFCQISR